MNTLRLPSSHPNSSVIQRWAADQESQLTRQTKEITKLQGLLKTILTNNPDLGKPVH